MSQIMKYNTMTFNDVWDNEPEFTDDFRDSGLNTAELTDTNLSTAFYLLSAKYGNSPIANADINQFKLKVHAILFQYGPNWAKELTIQSTLRGLQEADIISGAEAIYNHAVNPDTQPSTNSDGYLSYISDQNRTKYKKSKLEGYAILTSLLKTDVSEQFLRRFANLFKSFVAPERVIFYTTPEEDDDNE